MYHPRHNVKIIDDAKIVQTIDKYSITVHPVIYNSVSLTVSLLVYI